MPMVDGRMLQSVDALAAVEVAAIPGVQTRCVRERFWSGTPGPGISTSSITLLTRKADRPGHGRARSSRVPSKSLGCRLESSEVARAGGGHEGAAATRIGNTSGA